MRHGDTWWRTGNTKPMADRQIDQLIGLAQGILADGIVSQAEAEMLQSWLRLNHRTDNPYVSRLLDQVERVLADGVLDEDEGRELHDALMSWTGGGGTDGEESTTASLPLDSRSANRADCGQHFRLHRNRRIRDPEDDARMRRFAPAAPSNEASPCERTSWCWERTSHPRGCTRALGERSRGRWTTAIAREQVFRSCTKKIGPKRLNSRVVHRATNQGMMTCMEALVACGTATRGTPPSSVTNRAPCETDNANK